MQNAPVGESVKQSAQQQRFPTDARQFLRLAGRVRPDVFTQSKRYEQPDRGEQAARDGERMKQRTQSRQRRE